MSRKPCIAAFDVGTTSVKVCLFTPSLSLLAVSAQEYALHTQGDRVQAEAAQYWQALRAGLAKAVATAPDYEVAAIGLCTQGETFAPVDAQGVPLRPFIVWLDSRAQAEAEYLRSRISTETFYRCTGLPEISGALPLAKLLWLRHHEPDVFAAAHRFLLLEDYLLHRLTGRFVSEKALQTSTGWFHLTQDGLWREALDAVGVDESRLPELIECGEVVGALLPDAAEQLGLAAGVPVVAGAMDQTAAALAAGCVRPGEVTETTGTALVMAACTQSPVFREGQHHLTIYRHALPGSFLYLPIANTAGMALRWFRDTLCPDLPVGSAGYEALNALAAQAPCGCEGVVFLPFLAGSVDPDACPQARATFFGARLSTTRAHLARSVMESVAFLLRDFLDMLSALDCPVTSIRSLGGGSRSALWQQIKADVLERDLSVPACSEASAMGAALLAGWGVGLIARGTVPSTPNRAVYRPNPATAAAYRAAYARYHRLYQAVRPLFDDEDLL